MMLALILLFLYLAFIPGISATVASDFSITIYSTLTTSTTYSLVYTTTDANLIGGAGSIATQYSTHLATSYQVLPFIYVTTFVTEIIKTSAIANATTASTTTSPPTTSSLESSSVTSTANSIISTLPSTNSSTGLSKSATIAIATSFTVVVLFLLLLGARYYRQRRHYLAARMLAPRHDEPLHDTPIQIRSPPFNANTSSEFFDTQRLENVINQPKEIHAEEHPPPHSPSIISTVSALEREEAYETIPSYYMDPHADPVVTGIRSDDIDDGEYGREGGFPRSGSHISAPLNSMKGRPKAIRISNASLDGVSRVGSSNTADGHSGRDLGSIQEHGPSLAYLEGGRLPARAYSPSAYSEDDLGRGNGRRGAGDGDEV